MLKLKKLKVKGVRGIIDGPDLYFENGGLLLCGDNGTGKSSYIDAVEKILTDRCSSLEGNGRNISWRKQGSHIKSDESQIELTLTDGSKDIYLTLNTDFKTQSKQLRSFLDAAGQQSFVLRRRTLLNFIDAAPRERYQAIQGFLNLDEYTDFEMRLKDLGKRTEEKLEAKKLAKSSHERTLRGQLGLKRDSIVNASACIEVVNSSFNIIGVEPLLTLNDLLSREKAIDELLIPFKHMDALRQVQLLEEKIKQLSKVETLVNTAQKYAEGRKKVLDEEAKLKGNFYAEVLEGGLAWIKADSLELCPLCDNPISLVEVTAYVNARITENKQLILLKRQQSKTHTAFLSLLDKYWVDLKNVKKQWEIVFQSNFSVKASEIISLVDQIQVSHKSMLSISEIETDIARFSIAEITQIMHVLEETVKLKLDIFPDSTQYTQLHDAKTKLLAISKHLEKIQKHAQEIQHLKTCKTQLDLIADLAERGRKKAVQKLLDNVVRIADDYFQRIHPGESIGNPTLVIPKRGGGSIELLSKFHTETGDPRGHYSEGHVDSLGLCLFLAIRRIHHTQRSELSLLILDDVMQSVDANHRRNTANLIFDEFSDHQIIITTHDPIWFEYLKIASQKSRLKFVQRRIATWSLKTGPVWGDHLSNYEWLTSEKGKIAKPADKIIKVSLLLEEMLQNLCNNLGVSVPLRIRGDYTIGTLWTNFYFSAKKNKGFFAQTKKCLTEIDDLRNLRNWAGAHWNDWAQTLTNSEAESLTRAVLELRDHVYCDDCSQFIQRIATLDGVWSCKRECKRYNKKL